MGRSPTVKWIACGFFGPGVPDDQLHGESRGTSASVEVGAFRQEKDRSARRRKVA